MKVEDFIDSYGPKGEDFPLLSTGAGALTWYQTVHNNFDVRNFCVEIHGKTDDAPQRLAIHRDWDCPDFDLVVHLLWYIKLFNIQSGYLFPPKTYCMPSGKTAV